MSFSAFDKFKSLERKGSTKLSPKKPDKVSDSEMIESTGSNSSSSSSLQNQPPAKRPKNLPDEVSDKFNSNKFNSDNSRNELGNIHSEKFDSLNRKLDTKLVATNKVGSNSEYESDHNKKMSELRTKFFSEKVEDKKEAKNENIRPNLEQKSNEPLKKSATISLENPTSKEDHPNATTSKSASCSTIQQQNPAPNPKAPSDVFTKGACSSIKSMFEENIAVKKGLKPDPSLPQGGLVRVKPKVSSTLPQTFRTDKKSDPKRESIFVDKIIFKKFMEKFEDDESREQARSQLKQITEKQRGYKAKWTERQEEQRRLEREEEERRLAQEEAQRLWEEQEAKRLKEEEEERIRLEELRIKREQEEAEALAKKEAKKAAALAKKQARLLAKQPGEQVHLPKLVSSTYTDLKKRFQIHKQDVAVNPAPVPVNERPKVRKLLDNPFEQKRTLSEDADKKPSNNFLPNANQGRISEMKKRYSQFINSTAQTMVGTISVKDKTDDKDSNSEQPVQEDSKMESDSEKITETVITMKITEPKEEQAPSTETPKGTLLRRSKEHLDKSCEKIWRYSKEKINELTGNSTNKNSKPSKDDMQCYLLSHVLFDGQKPVVNAPKEPDWLDTLDEDLELEKGMMEDEYIKEMEKYLALFDSDDQKKKKKKSTKKKAKPKESEPAVKLKIVEVSDIKKRFEKMKAAPDHESRPEPQKIISPFEQTVDKVKDIFENQMIVDETPNEATATVLNRPARRANLLNQDLLKKFDSPELAAEMRKQQEKEREERRLQRIARLEEERKKAEEEKRRKEEEIKRLEEERLEAIRREEEERIQREDEERRKKEEEERAKLAYEEMLKIEKEKALIRGQKEAQAKEQREKNEPAFKKRKVLDRIQHVFEKNLEEDFSKKNPSIGSIRGKVDALMLKDDNLGNQKNFQDASLSGLSSVLGKVKDKFETKEEEPLPLYHKVSIQRKNIPAAETFELIEQKQKETSKAEIQRQVTTDDWAWKKKDPKQLAVESTIALYGASKEAPRKSEREKKKAEQQKELYSDIKSLNSRLSKRDPIKEHEEKMKEYASFMAEIQDYLNDPDCSNEEKNFKDDIQSYIEQAAATANKRKQAKKKSIDKIKQVQPKELIMKGSLSEIKEKLLEHVNFSGSSDTSSLNIGKEPCNYKNTSLAEGSKSSYEWSYKKQPIIDLLDFLAKNISLLPSAMTESLEKVKKNFVQCTETEGKVESDKIQEYNQLVSQINKFLVAPDKSKDEIDFKAEIEKHLDIIEEPANDKEKEMHKSFVASQCKISRKPQKINLTSLAFNKSFDKQEMEMEEPQTPKVKDSKFIKEMQLKLINDTTKEITSKEELVIHNVGTSRLKKEYEKLNQHEEIKLISAPKIITKKTATEIALSPTDKTDGKSVNEKSWKWKQKDMTELYQHIKDNYEVIPPALLEQQKLFDNAENCLQKEKHYSGNECENKLKQLEEDRDRELESFLKTMQDFLENETKESFANFQETNIKPMSKLESKEEKQKALLLTGNVSSIKSILEKQGTDEVIACDENVSDKWKRGKVNTDFLKTKNVHENASRVNEAVALSVDADKIKKRLVNQYFKNEETKTLFSAPKTKLKEFVVNQEKENKFSAALELGGILRENRSSTAFVNRSIQKSSSTSNVGQITIQNNKPMVTVQKSERKVEKYQSPYAKCNDEEERKAAILAKYGVKPRPLKESSPSSSISSEEDEQEIRKQILNQKEQLKQVYGLNDIKERKKERMAEQEARDTSLSSLRNVLSKIRDARNAHSNANSRMDLTEMSSNEMVYRSDLELADIKGTCSNTRAMFERRRLASESESSPREHLLIERSSTFSNVKNLFDNTDSPTTQSPRSSGIYGHASNRSFSNVKNVFEQSMPPKDNNFNRPSNVFGPQNRQNELEHCSSFSRVRENFERGEAFDHENESDSSDDESDDEMEYKFRHRAATVGTGGSQKDLIQAELDEIRSSSRISSMFRINHPASSRHHGLQKSASSSLVAEKLDLDSQTLDDVSKTRTAMKAMFESSAPRVTFGGAVAFAAEKANQPPITKKQPAPPSNNSDRGWMYDVINKYFDVIVEDEEESEDEEEELRDDDEEEFEEHEPVYATERPPPQKINLQTDCKYEEDIDEDEEESDGSYEDSEDETNQNFTSHVVTTNQRYFVPDEAAKVVTQEDSEDDDDESDPDEDHEPREQNFPMSRSASSSKMRTLFRSVIQRNSSGGDLRLETFKANLGTHLKLKGSNQSLLLGGGMMMKSENESEDYRETNKYYKVPL